MNYEKLKKLAVKASLIGGGVLAALGSAATIHDWIRPPGPELDPALFGSWHSAYQYPVIGGTVAFEGVTQYFRNGRYNVYGTLKFTKEASANVIVHPARGVGNWMANDDHLTITLTDMKVGPGRFYSGQISETLSNLEKVTGIAMPDVNKDYLPGSSDEYKVKSQSAKSFVLEGRDPLGKAFLMVHDRNQPDT